MPQRIRPGVFQNMANFDAVALQEGHHKIRSQIGEYELASISTTTELLTTWPLNEVHKALTQAIAKRDCCLFFMIVGIFGYDKHKQTFSDAEVYDRQINEITMQSTTEQC